MINLFNYSKKQIKITKKELSKTKDYEKKLENKSTEELKELIKELKDNKKINKSKITAILKITTKREYNIELFEGQLIAGLILEKGSIIEMKTGEGKTFSAMLTALISFVKNEKIYISTANDYLAKRDSEIVSKILSKLGIIVNYVSSNQKLSQKISNYNSDVVYGTLHMFAFDYLKDNLSYNEKSIMQKNKSFILIDEADLSLIDQARTPLSLTGDEKRDDVELYNLFNKNKFLEKNNDFEYDKESKNVTLLDSGFSKLENFLIENNFISSKEEMYLSKNLHYLHIVNNILKSEYIYKKDVDYVVLENEVIVIDEKTGRLSEGRRFGNGLHQAIEAKENVKIQKESNTIASITVQNYVKKFKKISGMSGTAKTEEREFKNTYGLKVVEIPTNKKMIREDYQDIIFAKKKAKMKAIVEDIKEKHKIGRPILIGTNSIESSMELGDLLYKEGLKYKILNAKNHEKESEIISNAGILKSITIATNMAGRGTDIMLGGNREDFIKDKVTQGKSREEAIEIWKNENKKINEIGGLYIIGAERNISRRMDNQLIGRAGRQGDAGGTQFFISLEDEIIKNYGLQKIQKIWSALGIDDEEAVSNTTVDMNIAAIQRKIEGANEEARKMVLSFDDINEEQRNIIYELRDKILYEKDYEKINKFVINFTRPQIAKIVEKFINDSYPEEYWDFKGLEEYIEKFINKKIEIEIWFKNDKSLQISDIIEKISNEFLEILKEKENVLKENYIVMQKEVILKVIDQHWGQQLSSLNELKNRVFFRSYAQQKPLEEYQKEIYQQFKEKINNIEEDLILSLSHFKAVTHTDLMLTHFRYGLSPILGVGI